MSRPVDLLRPVAALALLALVLVVPAPAGAVEVDRLRLPGRSFEPSTDAGSPSSVEAGTYRITLPASADDSSSADLQYLTYDRQIEGSTIRATLLVDTLPLGEESESLDLSIGAAGDVECDTAGDSLYGATLNSLRVVTPSEEPGADPDADPDPCLDADELTVSFGRRYSNVTDDLTASITLVEEAPTTDPGKAALGDAPDFTPPEQLGDDPTEEVEANVDWAQAPDLGTGVARTTITTGSRVVYSAFVDWGQSLDVEVFAGRAAAEGVDEYWTGPPLVVAIFDPGLSVSRTYTGTPSTLQTSDQVSSTAWTGPIRHLNLWGDEGSSLPGTYYIAIGVASPDDGVADFDVPLTIRTKVSGSVSGAPSFDTDEPYVWDGGPTDALGAAATDVRGPVQTVAALALAGLGVVSLLGGTLLWRRRAVAPLGA